ncbi:MAG TPA: malto-oligosyltrehalose synthase [Alphaproteobacteria bacterium]|jgi:malto-oligosyltrehalose synthase
MTARATYRLQLHAGFTFADAARQIGYLQKLGITDLYVSPILRARRGSLHGYDGVDPDHVNPELGGEDGLRHLVHRLREAGMGLVVDIVPNHMAASVENAIWMDVLAKGPHSAYAAFFDIDWAPNDLSLTGKVLLPILGRPYREILRDREIALAREGERVVVRYGDHRLPLRFADSATLLHEPLEAFAQDAAALDELLMRQHYRLAWWRTAGDRINWRRFFDINELVAVQVERPEVFEAVHGTILRLYAEGLIDGLRVDHVDGLTDPAVYCRLLRERLTALEPQRPAGAPPGPALLVVEKILGAGERLPAAWHSDGPTGYEFMNEVSALQHDPNGEAPLTRLWQDLSGRSGNFEAEERLARRETLASAFAGQHMAVARAFHLAARRERPVLDVSEDSFRRALAALLERFPVYRSYATRAGAGPDDAATVETARTAARADVAAIDMPALDFICATLLRPTYDGSAQPDAAIGFQKLSAPLAAKAVEDTAFYRYGRLLSRNDVGFDIRRFAGSAEAFHAFCRERAARFPRALSATATHDHKRGEDLRARLAVLSEIPERWQEAVGIWQRINADIRPDALAPADEYQLYQTIVGAWPLALDADGRSGLAGFAARLKRWQEKALREAKLRSSWATPDAVYETEAASFVDRLFDPLVSAAFLAHARSFVEAIAPAGALNGLTQALLRCCAPGTPDIYQGCEFWDFSLVDPDNRQDVDYRRRAASLTPRPHSALLGSWRDGVIKQALIAAALDTRRRSPSPFAGGDYEPLVVTGLRASSVVAFARRQRDQSIVVIAARCCGRELFGQALPLPSAHFWDSTRVQLPEYVAGKYGRNVLREHKSQQFPAELEVAGELHVFPAALYVVDGSASHA